MAVERPRRSRFSSVLRTILYALAIAFFIGLVIGTVLRRELERPTRYIGGRGFEKEVGPSALASDPRDVGHALACILMPSDHEEQI
jgi:hypothetical protein